MTRKELVLAEPVHGRRPEELAPAKRGLSWPHYLALIGVPILVWNTWTVIAWLADGPHQVNEFRDRSSVSWYAARVYEGAAIVASILVVVYLVRQCRREGRFLTFDVMFCLVGATLFWSDLGDNIIHPTFLPTANFVNLNPTCGHMPFVINPDCGRAPDPILFDVLLETFGVLGFAIILGAVIRRARQRWPGMSAARVVGLCLLVGLLADLIFEPLAIGLGLWTYNVGGPALPLGQGLRYPVLEAIAGCLFFGLLIALRLLKDDRGRTLVERGLEHHSLRSQKAITLMALYSFFQLVTWGLGTLPVVALGFYQQPWEKTPRHIVNDVCDAPGIYGTRYGPCPGGSRYRMPGRGSLPGHSP